MGLGVTLGLRELDRNEADGLHEDGTTCLYRSPSTRPGRWLQLRVARALSTGLRHQASILWTVEATARFCIRCERGGPTSSFGMWMSISPSIIC